MNAIASYETAPSQAAAYEMYEEYIANRLGADWRKDRERTIYEADSLGRPIHHLLVLEDALKNPGRQPADQGNWRRAIIAAVIDLRVRTDKTDREAVKAWDEAKRTRNEALLRALGY